MARFRKDRQKWEVDITVAGIRNRILFKKRGDAEHFEFMAKLRKIGLGSSERIKIFPAFQRYIETESIQKSKGSQKSDSNLLYRAETFFTIVCDLNFIDEITLEHLQFFQINCAKHLKWSDTTIAVRMKILKSVFKKLMIMGSIAKNPAEHWKIPAGVGKKRRAMNEHEFQELMNAISDHNAWLVDVLAFIRLTGARPIACAGLKWSDVDFSKAVVYLHSSKGGVKVEKTIEFPMHRNLYQLLANIWKHRDFSLRNEFVFGDNSRQPLTNHRISVAASRLIKQAKLTGVVLYSLRHALAVDLTESGVPMEITRQLMGHSSIRQTQEYAKGIGIKTLNESMEKIRGADIESPEANASLQNANVIPLKPTK